MDGRSIVDDATSATLAEVYAHGYGKDVRIGPMPARAAGTAGGVLLDRAPGFHPDVVRVLRAALSPRRWEPWNAYPEHRAYPSPRTAFLVDVQVRLGERQWTLDPVRERLTPVAATGAPGPAGAVEVLLSVHPDYLPPEYGTLATALAWMECGHVGAALAEAAAASGVRASWRPNADGGVLALTPGGEVIWPWTRVAAPRSSGLAPVGFCWDPRPLAGEVLDELVRAAGEAPPGSPANSASSLRHSLAVHRVTGTDDGWYGVTGGRPVPRRAGPAVDTVQAALTYPRGVVDVTGMNVGWMMTAPLMATISDGGPGQYRRLLLAAGATAQHVATAAAVRGLACRPMRSVREGEIEGAAGVPAGQDFLYLLIIGRQWVRGFNYDLTCPREDR
jgi:hypothetical protein